MSEEKREAALQAAQKMELERRLKSLNSERSVIVRRFTNASERGPIENYLENVSPAVTALLTEHGFILDQLINKLMWTDWSPLEKALTDEFYTAKNEITHEALEEETQDFMSYKGRSISIRKDSLSKLKAVALLWRHTTNENPVPKIRHEFVRQLYVEFKKWNVELPRGVTQYLEDNEVVELNQEVKEMNEALEKVLYTVGAKKKQQPTIEDYENDEKFKKYFKDFFIEFSDPTVFIDRLLEVKDDKLPI